MPEDWRSRQPEHVPVLSEQLLGVLAVKAGETIVDCTLGQGGHAIRLAEAAGRRGRLIGLDVDQNQLAASRIRLAQLPCRVELLRANFADLGRVLGELNVQAVDVLVADLGVSSAQLDDPQRGFSFSRDGPLDMRFDLQQRLTAEYVVNRYSQRQLAEIIRRYGQQPHAERIARYICRARQKGPIRRTTQLAELIVAALKARRRGRIHPATRTFQAIRIEVNGELAALEKLLAELPRILRKPGGRAAIISFHSLEDGLVKRAFRQGVRAGIYEPITDKPVTATPEQRRENPRCRSAKLRAVRRTDLAL